MGKFKKFVIAAAAAVSIASVGALSAYSMPAYEVFAEGSDETTSESAPQPEQAESAQQSEQAESASQEQASQEAQATEEPEQEVSFSVSVYHVDEKTGERIEDANNKYGDAIVPVKDLKAGDEALLIVAGNPVMETSGSNVYLYKYIVKSVTVNGNAIQASDASKGEYKFVVSSGMNAISVDFSGRMELSVADLSTLNWRSLLTVDNMLRLVIVGVLLFVSSGFFITLIKKGKIEKTTSDEFASAGMNVMKTVIENFLKDTVKPMVEKQTEGMEETNRTIETLMRVTLLSQENTPEARLEIIKELQKYKSTDQDLANQIKSIVDSSIKEREDSKQELRDSIQSVREKIDEIEEIDVGETEDSYGKL